MKRLLSAIGALGLVAGLAGVITIAEPSPPDASAHTPNYSYSCDAGLSLWGNSYESAYTNTWAMTINGVTTTGTFGTSFSKNLPFPQGGATSTWAVSITAGNGQNHPSWNLSESGSVGPCGTPPVDVCPNLDGAQETLPDGYQLVEGQCELIPPPVDVCPNLEGAQETVPEGYQIVDGKCELIPPPPTVSQCTAYSTVHTTDLTTWDLAATRATGHNELTAGALHIWTEGATSTDKAAGYYTTSFALADLGAETIAQSIDYTSSLGITPGLQLIVDFDHDGTADGILVGESVYGNDWWLSNSASQFVKDGAPNTGGGYGSNWFGTPNEWLEAFPNARVVAIGYSLGSGVHGDGLINKITLGCVNYTFGLPATVPPTSPPELPYTGVDAGLVVWLVSIGGGFLLLGAGAFIYERKRATRGKSVLS